MATSLLGLMQITIFRKLLMGADYSFSEARAEAKRLFLAGIRRQEGETACARPNQP